MSSHTKPFQSAQNKGAKTSADLAKSMLTTRTASKRVIVFVIGGISLAEVRSAYEVSRQGEVDVYIGERATVKV